MPGARLIAGDVTTPKVKLEPRFAAAKLCPRKTRVTLAESQSVIQTKQIIQRHDIRVGHLPDYFPVEGRRPYCNNIPGQRTVVFCFSENCSPTRIFIEVSSVDEKQWLLVLAHLRRRHNCWNCIDVAWSEAKIPAIFLGNKRSVSSFTTA